MHFSKIIPVAFFAGLAVAAPAPAPAEYSVDYAQLKQFSQDVQSWSSSTSSGFDQLKSERTSLNWQGQAADAMNNAFSELDSAVYKVTQAASQLSGVLDGATGSYQETEQSNAELWS